MTTFVKVLLSFLTDMTVFARVTLRTGTEIFIWLCIQTRASIYTGLVCAAVI